MENSLGKLFTITSFGESHGRGVGVTIDGCPAGLPLTEAVAMFIQHREPMIKATSDFIKKNGAVNGRIFSAITMVTQIMDEMLVSLVTGYQKEG